VRGADGLQGKEGRERELGFRRAAGRGLPALPPKTEKL